MERLVRAMTPSTRSRVYEALHRAEGVAAVVGQTPLDLCEGRCLILTQGSNLASLTMKGS